MNHHPMKVLIAICLLSACADLEGEPGAPGEQGAPGATGPQGDPGPSRVPSCPSTVPGNENDWDARDLPPSWRALEFPSSTLCVLVGVRADSQGWRESASICADAGADLCSYEQILGACTHGVTIPVSLWLSTLDLANALALRLSNCVDPDSPRFDSSDWTMKLPGLACCLRYPKD